MKKIITTFLFITTSFLTVLSTFSFAQAPNWLWAKSAGGNSNELIECIKTDLTGNVYIVGRFQSPTITFGDTVLTNASALGTLDFFIVKYDASGNLIWAKNGGGSDPDRAISICNDTNNNIYVTGYFASDSIILGDSTFSNSGGGGDFFIVKYDSSGTFQWAKSAGVFNEGETGTGISIDYIGNIVVVGEFSSVIVFDTISANNVGNSRDIFLVKYNSLGEVLWAKSAGGNGGGNLALGVSTDSNADIYITGYYYSSAITFDSITLTNSGPSNGFIAKYNESGSILWAKNINGTNVEKAYSVSIDTNDDVFVTGSYYSSEIIFEGVDTIMNAGHQNGFIVKYNSSGDVLWARSVGGSEYDESLSVTTDIYNNAYITGLNTSPAMAFDTDTLYNVGIGNVFIAKYNSSGSVGWLKNTTSNGSNSSNVITVNHLGEIFIGGLFEGSPAIDIGNTTLINTDGTTSDIFIAKLSSISTNIKEKINYGSVFISPNPSNGFFTFNNLKKESLIEIFDITGRIICQIESKNNYCNIDLMEKEKGIYFYKVINKNGEIEKGKIVIQ